ncbi:MAG: glycosyltransferase family 87 protein [Tepidisphaeraceae bacterium]|jgi:hypothetical protein
MMELTSHPRPRGTRRLLWKVGGLLSLFMLTLVIGNVFVSPDKAVRSDMIGHDFLAFYSAGTLARAGQFHNLYDLTTIKRLESEAAKTAGFTTGFGPWWNPPFAAWLFAPFSALPFPKALLLWEGMGLAMLIASIVLLARMIPNAGDWRNWSLLVLVIFASNPVLAVFAHAQNTFLTLLLLTLTVTFWRNRRAFVSGLIAGLLLYKPQHAAILGIALCFSLGWPAAAGFTVTALALAGITIFTMPGAMTDYVQKLPRLLTVMQELSPYAWDRHVTLKAFWRLLLQGTAPGTTSPITALLWWTSELAVAGALARIALQARHDRAQIDRFIAATIIASPLLVPFCFDYDLMILAIPAVLFAAESMRGREDRPLLWGWIVLYATLHISTLIARPTHLILATPMLGVMCGLMAIAKSQMTERAVAPLGIAPIQRESAPRAAAA